jgi:5'-3' exonuclease
MVTDEDPVHYAYHNINTTIKRLLKSAEVEDYRIFLGDDKKSNFRYKVAVTQPYKASRTDNRRPFYEKEMRAYLFDKYDAELVTGMEVDDVLGIEQTDKTLLCTNDKDLWMIPGWHFDPEKGKIRSYKNGSKYELKSHLDSAIFYITDPGFLQLKLVGKKQKIIGGGQLWFCAQLLLGDSTDDIPGVPGYGPVKTYRALQDVETYKQGIQKVWKIYQNVFNNTAEARLKEVAQLLWIKRNYKEKIFDGSWLK